MNIILGLF